MSLHTIQPQEIYMFASYINQNLKKSKQAKAFLPIDAESQEDLFNKIKNSNGLILQQLIIQCSGDKQSQVKQMFQKFIPPIPGKAALNAFQVKINMNLCLQVIKSLGINLINIDANDILSGNKVLIMGLLWQVIHLGLNNKIKQQQTTVTVDGKELNMVKYSDKEFEQLVLMWVKEQTGVDVQNFGKDFQSGDVLLKLLTKVCNDQLVEIDDDMNQQGELEKSSTLKIDDCTQLIKKLGINLPVRPEDIRAGNEKITFTLLAEILSVSLNKEMNIGRENTLQMQKLNVSELIVDQNFALCRCLDFFEDIPQFDKYRGNGQIDFNEVAIFTNELMKNYNVQQNLGFTEAQFDEITYQLLLSENLTSQQVMNLHMKTLQLSKDFLDKIFEIINQTQKTQLLKTCLEPILKYLIILGTDDIYQTQLVQYDFHYCLNKFTKLNMNELQMILLALYFAIMFKITQDNKFSISAQELLQKLKDREQNIKQLTLKSLLPCITSLVYDLHSFTEQINNQILMYIDKVSRQVWQVKDSIESETALNMLYSSYYKFKPSKQGSQTYCQVTINYLSALKNEQIKSIISLDTYKLFNKMIYLHPNEIAKLIMKQCQPEEIIRYIMEFDIDDLTDNYQQISLSSKCMLLSTLREFTFIKDADKQITKQVQQLLVLPGIPNPGQITYKDITENNLANELLRSAARQATYALVKYDLQIVEMMTEILDQVIKSTSIVAFRESIKDILMISEEVKQHQQNMLLIFDLILACTKKYEGNMVVMLDVLELAKKFADDKYFVQCGAFEQIDAMSYPFFKQRRISMKYLQIVKILAEQNFDIYYLVINSIVKIQQVHEDDISVMSLFYQVLTVLNDDRVIQHINFVDDLVQILGKYSEQPQFVYIIFKCLLTKISFNAELAMLCQRKNIYKLVINYTKYIKQSFRNSEYTQYICETAIDIILTAINMISDYNIEEAFDEIEKILIM